MEKYRFHRHSKAYARLFAVERQKLSEILGRAAKIAHVGSTAVSELGGKGIIDVVIAVQNLVKARHKLEAAEYEFRKGAGTKTRLFFRRDYRSRTGTRRVHLHVVRVNSKDWREMIAFRDYLKKHPAARHSYEKIKREGVKKAKGAGEVYRQHKKAFIENITMKALEK